MMKYDILIKKIINKKIYFSKLFKLDIPELKRTDIYEQQINHLDIFDIL